MDRKRPGTRTPRRSTSLFDDDDDLEGLGDWLSLDASGDGGGGGRAWDCAVCTYRHDEPGEVDRVTCALCLNPRPDPIAAANRAVPLSRTGAATKHPLASVRNHPLASIVDVAVSTAELNHLYPAQAGQPRPRAFPGQLHSHSTPSQPSVHTVAAPAGAPSQPSVHTVAAPGHPPAGVTFSSPTQHALVASPHPPGSAPQPEPLWGARGARVLAGDADDASIVAWLRQHLDEQDTLPSWSALKAEVMERYPNCEFETSGIKERCRILLRAKCDAIDAKASAQVKTGTNPAVVYGGKPAAGGRPIGHEDRVLESGCWIEPALQRAVAERDGFRTRAGTGIGAVTATRVERVMESGCWIEVEVEA